MKTQEIKNYIKQEILAKKNVSNKKITEAITLLEIIKDKEDVKEIYNNLMGKILMKQSKYLEAKKYFQEELLINPNSTSAHFHLYKISVFENNYEEAINNLSFCKNSEHLNIGADLPLTILQMIIDLNKNLDKFLNTNYTITTNYYSSYNNLNKTSVRNLYSKIINNFNNKDYQELKLNLIELDKIAGEPVELYANGKLIANGEVVVIEDNFGLRITNILSPDSRLKNL